MTAGIVNEVSRSCHVFDKGLTGCTKVRSPVVVVEFNRNRTHKQKKPIIDKEGDLTTEKFQQVKRVTI